MNTESLAPQAPTVSTVTSSLGFLVNDDALGNLVKFLTYYGEEDFSSLHFPDEKAE